MASPLSYRQAVQLLQRWPKDAHKQGKDLGEHLRQLVSLGFPSGSASADLPASSSDCPLAKDFGHWERLADDTHKRRHPRLYPDAGNTGLSREMVRQMADPRFLVQAKEHHDALPWYKKLF